MEQPSIHGGDASDSRKRALSLTADTLPSSQAQIRVARSEVCLFYN